MELNGGHFEQNLQLFHILIHFVSIVILLHKLQPGIFVFIYDCKTAGRSRSPCIPGMGNFDDRKGHKNLSWLSESQIVRAVTLRLKLDTGMLDLIIMLFYMLRRGN